MSGIAGWVDYRRDLTVEGGVVRAMAATLALRGPDAEGIWLDGHAGLGHRRLAVLDVEGGAQPMTVEHDGTTIAAVTFSGAVYNYRELREQLRGLGHVFRTAGPTEVVLHAYLAWGDAFVDRLNGMYAIGLWDTTRQRLLLVRDRMGVKPLYYAPTPDGVLFGSEPKAILAHPSVSAAVDTDGLRELLAVVRTPGSSIYRGISEVRAGHIVVVDPSGVHPRRYWGLHAGEHRDDLAMTVRTVRELLEDIVTRQLVADVPLGALLSGGLDSSAVAALATGSLQLAGAGPLRTFAVDFAGQAEAFVPDALRDTPDTPYLHEVVKHVGTDHTDVLLETADLTDPVHRGAGVVACDGPLGSHDIFLSLYLLYRAVRQHATVALSGEAADEVFCGYRWYHDQRTVHATTFPWLAHAQLGGAQGRRLVGLLDPQLLATLDLDTFRADSYRQALAEVEHLPDESPTEHRMRELSHLHLTRFLPIMLDRRDRLSMASGLEVRVPYCDHRLVEYVYNTPWAMKTFDGREKSLLRAAASDLLPEPVLQRRQCPYPSIQDPAYERALWGKLADTLDDRASPLLDLLDRRQARTHLMASAARAGSAGEGTRLVVELMLGLDQWLRRYPVRLAL